MKKSYSCYPWNDLKCELKLYVSPALAERLGLEQAKTTVEHLAEVERKRQIEWLRCWPEANRK